MPHFYFDIVDDGRGVSDEWGVDFVDVLEAGRQAQSLAVEIARERLAVDGQRDIVVTVRCDGRDRYKARLTIRGEWVAGPAFEAGRR